MKIKLLTKFLLLILLLNASIAFAAQMTGELSLADSDGAKTTTYQAGDKVYISLKDSDRNGNAGAVDEVKVLITTETENRTKASVGMCDSWEWNQGDGTLTVTKTGYDTKTEDWTLTCVNVEGNPKFKVV